MPLVCINDYEKWALAKLPLVVRDYYKSGAGEEVTLSWNKEAFKKLRIRYRVLRNVSKRDISTTILGHTIAMPVGIAPTAMQKMAHTDGECATVKAAEAAKTIFILSTLSTSSIEEVAEAAPNAIKWFQLYIYNDRSVTFNLIQRAEKAGFKALVLTVDTPMFGDRRADIRNKFCLPSHLRLANFNGHLSKKINNATTESGLSEYVQNLFDDSLSWDDIIWLKSITKLPLVLKGIMTVEDALLGVKHGADAILVSNHGARQIDGTPAPIEVLPEIIEAVNNKVEVYMDGGVTQGTDVFKALAFGAKMVFIGRPIIWGLSYGGESGVKQVLGIMHREVDRALALSGCRSIKEITREMVVHESKFCHL